MQSLTSPASVEQISALDDPALRNVLITQSYHELSTALTKRLGPVANWCTFATWASKQAGQSIRQEDLARALEHWLGDEALIEDLVAAARLSGSSQAPDDIRRLIREVIDPRAALQRAGLAVGRGNQKVYAEIGLEFARYLENCSADLRFDAENIGRFCAALRPGEPPEGQRYLRQAFGRYYQAMFETDAKNRAEYVLLANLEIGFHEQTRLQPEIAEALNASVVDPRAFARRFVTALFPYAGWFILGGWFFLRLLNRPSPLDTAIDRFLNQIRGKIRLLLTDYLMELRFPRGQRLHLGRDLSGAYPPALQHLTYPDLRALLEKIDPTPNSLIDSGARDWADLPDRMHFITDLFRCYQERAELLEPPFSAEQEAAMKSGRLPDGPL